MSPEEINFLVSKLNSIVTAVRFQNSGADVHIIGNIRHTAGLLMDVLLNDPNSISLEFAQQITSNTEEKLVEFYRNKYIRGY